METSDPDGQRFVKFCIDGPYDSPEEEQATQHVAEEPDIEWTPREPSMSVPAFPGCVLEQGPEDLAPQTEGRG